jgi:phospholipid transport system substrate-binding protein
MSGFERFGFISGLLLVSAMTFAQDKLSTESPGQSAHDIVRDASDRVMLVVEEARDYAEGDPERYYTAVHEVLDPVIDFRGFAKNVMGPYASRDRYQSLDEAGREELRGQLEQFTEVMRKGLIKTYGKGLLAFGGSRIEISDPSEEEAGQSRVSVRQLIYSDEIKPYVMMYQMGRDKKSGEWKLRNVIIETVNLGEIYKNQFQADARRRDGDLNAVIDNWSSVEAEI